MAAHRHWTARGRRRSSDRRSLTASEANDLARVAARFAKLSRLRAVALATIALLAILALLCAGILLSERDSRAQIVGAFGLRGASSATFVSTFITQQAERESQAAMQFLSARRVSAERFRVLVAEFGSHAAVLLDRSGRVLDVVPADEALLGSSIAGRYAHLAEAERGRVAVSNVVPSAARHVPVAAIAVPFQTPAGRRVFSVAYRTSDTMLEALVDHTIAYRQHAVFLVDSSGRLLAASPATSASTLRGADPQLARAAEHRSHGAVAGARTPTTFNSTPVPGTDWRLLIAVPNSHLYASIGGLTHTVSWIVWALVGLLGALLIALLARSLGDRVRLANLAQMLERSAYTDSLTGLLNRRALSEHLRRAAAHARRRGEPLSILMIDLDQFKETNDQFGHDAGDRVLRAFAECMSGVLRAEDVCGRWGGDEFVMILPTTDRGGAVMVRTRLLAAAAAVALADIGLPEGIGLSVGCATSSCSTPHDLLRTADLDLYRAKAARRAGADTTLTL
jgi:diguanylate cyclase (GGDEF)-like protein